MPASTTEQSEARIEPEQQHELLRVCAERGFTLNGTLHDMLNEHYSHRTERRGAGYTQATRHLAAFVNRAQRRDPDEPRMFRERFDPMLAADALRAVSAQLEREESRLLASIILDLVLPAAPSEQVTELPSWPEDLKIGTCPLAEKYFLELAEAFVRRKGSANVLVAGDGTPVLIEKVNLGDDHSCISVAPVILNGVGLPPGSLFGVRYEGEIALRPNRNLRGSVIPISACAGFRFLRLSTLAVSPQHRERAFTTHFQAQIDAGLFGPREATVEQLRRVAQSQL
ncbi:MAG: hypothetical protein ABW061_16850 [Polyangiaceae bacterium]